MVRPNKTWLLAGAALIVAGLGGYGVARWTAEPAEHAEEAHEGEEHAGEEAGHEEEGDAHEEGLVALTPQQAAAAGVTVATVERGGGAEIVIPGLVSAAPNALAGVQAPVSGSVQSVNVAAGSRVGAGAVIATLRSAEAATSRAAADTAAASLRAAEAVEARERRLFEAKVSPRQDWEASQLAVTRAQAELRAAQAHFQVLGQPGANGVISVRTPIGGVVAHLDVQPGGFVAAGTAIAEITDPSRVEYVFNAPSAVSATIRPGQAIRVQLPDGTEGGGVITAIAPGVTGGNTATIRARASGVTPPSGTVVSARVVTGGTNAGLRVPSDAVQTVEGRAVVFVASPEGFRATPVVPGRVSGGYTEIIQGLAGNEQVAARGAFLLKAELAKGEAGHDH